MDELPPDCPGQFLKKPLQIHRIGIGRKALQRTLNIIRRHSCIVSVSETVHIERVATVSQ